MTLRAIQSVLSQTYNASEIIVVDDGSTDGTDDLFPISGVTYHKITHSGYPGKVRNIGVELSKYDHIAFLDSDDIWMKDKLEKQVAYFKSHLDCRLLHTKERWIMNDKLISQKKRKHKKSGNVFKDSLQGCILGPSTVLMEKKLFNEFHGFDTKIEVGEDYDLWLRITDRVDIDYIDDELITKYAGHGDQLSFKYGYIEPFKIHVLEKNILEGNFKPQNREYAVESLSKKYEIIIGGCIKRNKQQVADNFISKRDSFFKEI